MTHALDYSTTVVDNRTVTALLTVNRVPETIGYNVAYLAIGLGLASTALPTVLATSSLSLAVLFTAIMLGKMQASVADALHDQSLDAANPEKSVIAAAVGHLGRDVVNSLLVTELVVALVCWSWLTYVTGSLLYVACGAALAVLGYVYSYPPRLKERGVLNHVTTTSVDVCCVVLPVAMLAGATPARDIVLTLAAIWLYTFAYHVMHQAADTYYDRTYGIETFTQDVGVTTSTLLAAGATIAAGVIAGSLGYTLGALLVALAGLGYLALYHRIRGLDEQAQTDRVADAFDIAIVATVLNTGVAISILL